MAKRKLLIIEDDPGLQKQLKWAFEDYDTTVVGERDAAMNEVRRLEPAVVTLDLGLPPDPANASVGLALLDEILAESPLTKVIVVTGNNDRQVAVAAVGQGAYDFYEKPVEPEELQLIIERAYRLHDLEAENQRLLNGRSAPLDGLIAGSSEMTSVCRKIEKVGPTETTVLLLGESGTGKEILARALHRISDRAENNFVAINCAAIPEALLESELFGYEKGAFTGAAKTTKGKIEYANGGTLFLDEVGDLPQPLQGKLLRFLQERVIERVGGREELPVDIRVICATHKDLQALIGTQEFREDLYYRISEVAITIPPLRERTGDSILIARALLERFKSEQKSQVKGFSQSALKAIENYGWPGNVRELENRIKRAFIMADGQHIEAVDLELNEAEDEPLRTLKQIRDEAELKAIERALALFDGNIVNAASALGVSRPTIYHLLKKFNLESS
ncbi:MAG: PEP-CTERM-box response regulator transcription factor [Gammaproteobacteria bacterium]|nr:PEP-CTERM-box response regulator transcription factor [Gammaproteobacteria bacterium]NNM01921.1 PEP-CTERM-box response regulator transcription factor [Gammaproteobacteria bacterium]